MTSPWKTVARNLTPPVLWNAASRLKNALFPPEVEYGERDSAWYNQDYRENKAYHGHYTGSRYYFIWTVVADRLIRVGARSVLDIGCGAGQVAALLREKGIARYVGIDLSEEAIRRAKSICPAYEFHACNVFATDLIETLDYDAVISFEFLEHVNEDISVLRRIPTGRRVIGSVPNFLCASHVRRFLSSDEVVERYGGLFEQFRVDPLLADNIGTTFYLFEGLRSERGRH